MFWRSLQYRCMETIAEQLPLAWLWSDSLTPGQRTDLLTWCSDHDCLPMDFSPPLTEMGQPLLRISSLRLSGNQTSLSDSFLSAIASVLEPDTLRHLSLACGYGSYSEGLTQLLATQRELAVVELAELKIVDDTKTLCHLNSAALHTLNLLLYVRSEDWSELACLVAQHAGQLRKLAVSTRGVSLPMHTDLFDSLVATQHWSLTDLELNNFQVSPEGLSSLLIHCRALKRLKLSGSMQFELDTMLEIGHLVSWEVLDLSFQVTPPMETYRALQHLPPSLVDLSYRFGPSNRNMIVSSILRLPKLKKLRYNTEFFNDNLVLRLVTVLGPAGLISLDVGQSDTLTDHGLAIVVQCCPDLRSLWVHSDQNKTNRTITAVPMLAALLNVDGPSCRLNLKVLYLNYFKALSGDVLQVIVMECPCLEELHVAGVSALNDPLLEHFANNGHRIHTLDIRNSFHVTDVGVIKLAMSLPLRFLNISMCYRVTDASIRALELHCPATLDTLICYGLRKVSEAGLQRLRRACHRRLKHHLYHWFS